MNNLLNTLIWYFFTDILNNFLCILSIPISIQLSLDVMYLWEKIAFLCEQPKQCLWFVNGMVMTFSLEIDDFQRGAFFFFSEKFFKTLFSKRGRMTRNICFSYWFAVWTKLTWYQLSFLIPRSCKSLQGYFRKWDLVLQTFCSWSSLNISRVLQKWAPKHLLATVKEGPCKKNTKATKRPCWQRH